MDMLYSESEVFVFYLFCIIVELFLKDTTFIYFFLMIKKRKKSKK